MPETGHNELTSEKPPGLEQWVKGEHEEEDEEQRRAQEAREEERRAQEAREEKRRAQEAREEQRRAQKALEQRKAQEEQEREAKKAQEEREKEVKAQEERERQAKEAKAHEEQGWQVRETEAREEQREQERKIEAQGGHEEEGEGTTRKGALKKEKKRILCKNITTCRTDTWRGGKSLGGSVSTMDRTYGRREAVDECGVQPPEPRERCALLKKPSVNLERQKERDRGDGEKKKATRCTSCCTYPPTQLHQPNNSSNSSRSTQQLHSETGSLRRSERVTFALAPLLRKQRTTR